MASFSKSDIQSAYRLIKEFETPRPVIYWIDVSITTGLFWGSLLLCFLHDKIEFKLLFGLASSLLLYRAMLFVHEIVHLKKNAVPGLWTFWNCTLGIPLLMPSYIFESHHDHHARERYATDQDPEYDFYTTSHIGILLLYLVSGLYMPIVLLMRQLVLVPLSYLVPAIRKFLDEQGSSATIHPRYRRTKPINKEKLREWRGCEALSCLVSFICIGAILLGWLSWLFLIHLLAISALSFTLNNFRSVTSHRFELSHGPFDFDKQVTDSLNFDQGIFWVHLWAPVGMRYHALHHLFPSLPYHSLTKAHQMLLRSLPKTSPYHDVNEVNYNKAFKRLVSHSWAHTFGSKPHNEDTKK